MIFYLYLILAGSMRFIVEFWRVNPVVGAGLTEYQWMSLTLIVVGAGLLFYQMETGSKQTGTQPRVN